MRKHRKPTSTTQLWIKERLVQLRFGDRAKDQKGLAAAMGLPIQRVSEIISGKRRIDVREIPAVADYLELAPIDVVASIAGEALLARSERQTLVRAIIEANAWHPPVLARPRLSPLGHDPRFPDAEQMVLEVADDSGGYVYPRGSFLLCIALDDVARELRDGDHVVAERRQNGVAEFTCWEINKGMLTPMSGASISNSQPKVRPRQVMAERKPTALVIASRVSRQH